MSIALWSPSLDEKGNSCRGIQFCEVNGNRISSAALATPIAKTVAGVALRSAG